MHLPCAARVVSPNGAHVFGQEILSPIGTHVRLRGEGHAGAHTYFAARMLNLARRISLEMLSPQVPVFAKPVKSQASTGFLSGMRR